MRSKAIAVAVLCVSVCGGTARALEATIPVTNVTVTNSGFRGSTVRLDLGSLDSLSEEMVLWARLSLPLSGNASVSELNVAVAGLLTAGGDPDPSQSAEVSLGVVVAPVSLDIDVTDLIRAIADGEAANHGLLLRPSDTSQVGFTSAEMAVLGSLQGGELRVSYRKLTAYGIRGGASALAERKRAQRLDDRRGRPNPGGGAEATSRPR